MTSPARPSFLSCAKRRSMRLTANPLDRRSLLPRQGGRWRARRAGGGYGRAMLHAPSTMLRMVPLPRFAEEDQYALARRSQPNPEMVGDGEDVLVAAAAHVHHHQVIARQGRGDLGDMGQGMRRLQCRDDALLSAAQLKRLERFMVGDRDIFDAAEIVQPGVLGADA